jgi:hypothetical protein
MAGHRAVLDTVMKIEIPAPLSETAILSFLSLLYASPNIIRVIKSGRIR